MFDMCMVQLTWQNQPKQLNAVQSANKLTLTVKYNAQTCMIINAEIYEAAHICQCACVPLQRTLFAVLWCIDSGCFAGCQNSQLLYINMATYVGYGLFLALAALCVNAYPQRGLEGEFYRELQQLLAQKSAIAAAEVK